MNIKEATRILGKHQKWRKGKDVEMIKPKLISEAINVILDYLKDLENEKRG